MTPRVATVLSARPWEASLVATARETALVRLVVRAYQPDDVQRHREELDAVVVGAETSWVTPAAVASWRRAGLLVIGVFPAGDRPARRLLESGGADEVFADDVAPAAILQAIRFLQPATEREAQAIGKLVVVTGGRGAPGRTEVALALSWMWSPLVATLLVDGDITAPALAVRTGRAPRPDITDAADGVRVDGRLPPEAVRRFGKVAMVIGSHRPGEPPLRLHLVEDVIEAALAEHALVVVDAGPAGECHELVKRSDHAVAVVDASPIGIVRAATMAAEWGGPPPAVVINRATRPRQQEAVAAVRRWMGLDPVAMVPDASPIAEAARTAAPPHRTMRRALRRMDAPR